MNTGVFKIPAIVRLYQIQTPLRGGTGKRIDPNFARAVRKPFLLAGGMNCENIVRAARIARPFAVDVNSGVETDGMKDKEKIQAVIRLLARSGLRKG